jgi:hypothetical protein
MPRAATRGAAGDWRDDVPFGRDVPDASDQTSNRWMIDASAGAERLRKWRCERQHAVGDDDAGEWERARRSAAGPTKRP